MNYLVLIFIFFACLNTSWADDPTTVCNNVEEARDVLSEEFPKISRATNNELIVFLEVVGEQCAEFLRQDEQFQREIHMRITIRQTEMFRPNNQRFDLTNLNQLHQILGTAVPQALRDRLVTREAQARSECGTVDRRAEIPPVRDQGSIGWCYAFAAADLISHRSGQNVSAIDLALNYNLNRNVSNVFRGYIETARNLQVDLQNRSVNFDREILDGFMSLNEEVTEREGGWSEIAINVLSNEGYCLESTLPSDSHETAQIGGFLGALGDLEQGRTSSKNAPTNAPTNASADYLVGDFCQRYGGILGELNVNIGMSELVSAIGNRTVVELFYERSMDACRENRIQVDARAVQVRSHEAGEGGLVGLIDQQLNSGGIAGLNYHVDLIGATAGEFSLHASSVVGRRWSDESRSCQYLIRNSWGESCFLYGEMNGRCENGHIWVNASELEDRSTGVFHLE
jgi:C1A family cysteine protease